MNVIDPTEDLIYKDKVALNLAVESNPTVFARLYKLYLANKRDIHCSICRYHKGENRTHFRNRSWKSYRQTQYKVREAHGSAA